jgi:hypothetical protein
MLIRHKLKKPFLIIYVIIVIAPHGSLTANDKVCPAAQKIMATKQGSGMPSLFE